MMASPLEINQQSVQSLFLEQIRNRLASHLSFVDELAEVLSISRDSAYRRIRGETVLSLDEAKKLYDRFGVSIDALFSPASNMALFHHRALTVDYSLDNWLSSLSRNFEVLKRCQHKEMIFAAKDIPIFQYFRLAELSAFKMFFWLKSIIKDPFYAAKKFTIDVIPVELILASKKVYDQYADVPSIEIWSDEAINETIKQVEFYQECGFFKNENDAILVLDSLLNLIDLINKEAAEGRKTGGDSFKLFENEILIADNTVFAYMDSKRVVYISYNSLNLLTTFQESFCAKTEVYLNNLIKNSILISATAEKERNKFFNKMKDRIETMKRKLN
jgi:hypothetical protein